MSTTILPDLKTDTAPVDSEMTIATALVETVIAAAAARKVGRKDEGVGRPAAHAGERVPGEEVLAVHAQRLVQHHVLDGAIRVGEYCLDLKGNQARGRLPPIFRRIGTGLNGINQYPYAISSCSPKDVSDPSGRKHFGWYDDALKL